jgi:hypothetical protein
VPNPFESPGGWLRCALHAHTTASDGELAPCTPARRITLVAGAGRGASVCAARLGYVHRAAVLAEDVRGITQARLAIPPHAPYARLEVHDATGGTAWTNVLR